MRTSIRGFNGALEDKFLVEPVANDMLFSLVEMRLVHPGNDGSVTVCSLVDVDWIFAPANFVKSFDHAELARCQCEDRSVVAVWLVLWEIRS